MTEREYVGINFPENVQVENKTNRRPQSDFPLSKIYILQVKFTILLCPALKFTSFRTLKQLDLNLTRHGS